MPTKRPAFTGRPLKCDGVASRLHEQEFRVGVEWLLKHVLQGDDVARFTSVMCGGVASRLYDFRCQKKTCGGVARTHRAAGMQLTDTTGRCYYVYWIAAGPRAYFGATVDPRKRLRQHNGELAGGAARTCGRGPWRFVRVTSGFRTWQEALQYEWAAKHCTRRCRSGETRRAALDALDRRERWTSNSPAAVDVPLAHEEHPTRYGEPTAADAIARAPAPAAQRPATSIRRRRFRKILHGVTY
jgi:predicted GIY-YIG superfamily endonuclease